MPSLNKYCCKSTVTVICTILISFLSANAHAQFNVDSTMKTRYVNKGPDTGRVIKDFSLLNFDGKYVSLNDLGNAKGAIIIFTCNHCPFAKLYPARLNALNEKYKPLGFPLLAINPMDSVLYESEEYPQIRKKALADKINFPYLQDASQSVAKQFNANHTPQAYVIVREPAGWVVRYCGAIDDNGEHAEKATPFVANAVNDLLSNRAVSKPVTKSLGCKIMYRRSKG